MKPPEENYLSGRGLPLRAPTLIKREHLWRLISNRLDKDEADSCKWEKKYQELKILLYMSKRFFFFFSSESEICAVQQ